MQDPEEFENRLLEAIEDNPEFLEKIRRKLYEKDENSDDGRVSRRGFLKKIAGGAAGLGAAAMIPSAAGLNIRSDKGLSYFNNTKADKAFSVDSSGMVETADLKVDSLSIAGGKKISDSDELGNQKVFNVRDYGAEGDGASNDQPAIQSAVDDAVEEGNAVVYFPQGEYLLQGSGYGAMYAGKDTDGIEFVGDGPQASVIRSEFDVDSANLTGEKSSSGILVVEGTSSDPARRAVVRDLGFKVTDDWPRRGISMNYCEEMVVDNVRWDSTMLDSSQSGSAEGVPTWLGGSENEFRSKKVVVRGSHFRTTPGDNPAMEVCGTEYARISDNYFDTRGSSDNAGCKIEVVKGLTYNGNIHRSEDDGLNLLSVADATVNGNYFECEPRPGDKDAHGITIGGGDTVEKRNYSVTGNTFRGYTGAAVRLFSGVQRFTVTGNTARNIGNFLYFNTIARGTVTGNNVYNVDRIAITNDGGPRQCDGLNISGNFIENVGNYHVEIYSPQLNGVNITGNTFSKAADFNTDMIKLKDNPDGEGVQAVNIQSNMFERAGNNAVRLPSTAKNFVIAGNTGSAATVNYDGSTSSTEVIRNNVSF